METRQEKFWTGAVLGSAILTTVGVFCFVPPVLQDPQYHHFADQRTVWHIHNFWNVISNFAFVIAAAFGLPALRSDAPWTQPWERAAFRTLLCATFLIACGSAIYHLSPDSASLVWDRLPMTIVFMTLFAATLGERISMDLGRALLLPLLVTGIFSVLYWRCSGDLRLYAVVQFFPMLTIPVLLLVRPARYTGGMGMLGTIALYGAAKLLEWFDRPLTAIAASGGHPWKHVAAAAALLCYVTTVARRVRLDP